MQYIITNKLLYSIGLTALCLLALLMWNNSRQAVIQTFPDKETYWAAISNLLPFFLLWLATIIAASARFRPFLFILLILAPIYAGEAFISLLSLSTGKLAVTFTLIMTLLFKVVLFFLTLTSIFFWRKEAKKNYASIPNKKIILEKNLLHGCRILTINLGIFLILLLFWASYTSPFMANPKAAISLVWFKTLPFICFYLFMIIFLAFRWLKFINLLALLSPFFLVQSIHGLQLFSNTLNGNPAFLNYHMIALLEILLCFVSWAAFVLYQDAGRKLLLNNQ